MLSSYPPRISFPYKSFQAPKVFLPCCPHFGDLSANKPDKAGDPGATSQLRRAGPTSARWLAYPWGSSTEVGDTHMHTPQHTPVHTHRVRMHKQRSPPAQLAPQWRQLPMSQSRCEYTHMDPGVLAHTTPVPDWARRHTVSKAHAEVRYQQAPQRCLTHRLTGRGGEEREESSEHPGQDTRVLGIRGKWVLSGGG